MKLNWRWLSPEAEGAGAIGGGEVGGDAGNVQDQAASDQTSTPAEGDRPSLQVVKNDQKPEPSWKEALPEDLRDLPGWTPEKVRQYIAGAAARDAAERKRQNAESIKRSRERLANEHDEALDGLVGELMEDIGKVNAAFADAPKDDPRVIELANRGYHKALLKIISKISTASAQAVAQQENTNRISQAEAKKAFWSDPAHQDVLGDPRLAAKFEELVDGRGFEATAVLGFLREMKGLFGYSTPEEDREPLSADDMLYGLPHAATMRLKREMRAVGSTEGHSRYSSPASKAEEKKYKESEAALIETLFPTKRRRSGYGG